MLKKTYDWIGTKVNTPYAITLLAVLSFLESLVFPPVAPILVLYCIEQRKKSFWFATVATVCSVLGGVVAYYIGFALWQSIGQKLVAWLATPAAFNALVAQYQKYQTWAVLIGSFSPIPYKVIGITAGFCKLSLPSFTIFSLIGRGTRYYLVAAVAWWWGNQIKTFIDRWFYYLVGLFVILVGGGFFVIIKP